MALIAALWFLSTTALASDGLPAGLVDRIEATRARFGVPGLAVSVVVGDDIVYEGGFGVTSRANPQPVDEHTLFGIASVTKTFTASAVATLRAQGKLDWDDAVITHLPWFRLSQDYATGEATLRDLLSHRTGLARGDRIALGGFDRSETVRRLRNEPFTNGFRQEFTYSNVLYGALGLIVEARFGRSWEAFVQNELFDRLGMRRTLFYGADLLADDNLAKPHVVVDYLGTDLHAVEFQDSRNYAPAGGIYSSAHDLALWIRAHLKRLQQPPQLPFDAETQAVMESPQSLIPQEGYLASVYPEAHFLAYGLGWFVTEYAGERFVFHPGGGAGVAALVAMVPERRLGVAVLANHGWVVKDVVANTVLDHLLERPARDWTALLSEHHEGPQGIVRYYKELVAQRVKGTSPSLPLEGYVGIYEHPVYGAAQVELADARLVLRSGKILADLEHWHYDTFAAYHRNLHIGFDTVTFVLDASGRPAELQLLDVAGYRRRDAAGQHH